MGLNRGAKPDTLELLGERLDALKGRRKVLLVGWSLGGLLHASLPAVTPARSAAVVTLGTPFSGDLKTNTNVREFYEWVAGHDVNQPPFERRAGKPPVPCLALWSRKDGIVAPSAARGLAHEVDKAVEIDTRHTGFAVHRPALSRVVAEIRIFLTEVEGRPGRDGTDRRLTPCCRGRHESADAFHLTPCRGLGV